MLAAIVVVGKSLYQFYKIKLKTFVVFFIV